MTLVTNKVNKERNGNVIVNLMKMTQKNDGHLVADQATGSGNSARTMKKTI